MPRDESPGRCSSAGATSVTLASLSLNFLGACSFLGRDWTQETPSRPSLLFLKFYHCRSRRGGAWACSSASPRPRQALALGKAVPRAGPCWLSHAPPLTPGAAAPPSLARSSPPWSSPAPSLPTLHFSFPLQISNPPAGIPVPTEALLDARNTDPPPTPNEGLENVSWLTQNICILSKFD